MKETQTKRHDTFISDLTEAVSVNHVERVESLCSTQKFKLIHKQNPALIIDDKRKIPLVFYVKSEKMLAVLVKFGVNINEKNGEGHSALSNREIWGDYPLLLTLLRAGVVASQDEYHHILRRIIPFHDIEKSKVSEERRHCIDAMVERIDDIPQRTLVDLMIYALEYDITHLQYFCFNKIKDFSLEGSDCHSVPYYAVWKHKLDFFKAYFLILPKSDLLSPDLLCSAVLSAARHVNRMALLTFFCESKHCDINQPNSDGGRPMYYALRAYDDAKDHAERKRAFDVVRYLKDKGARLEPFNTESEAYSGVKANWYRITSCESYHTKKKLDPELILYLIDSGSTFSVLRPSDLFGVLEKMLDYSADTFDIKTFLIDFFNVLDQKKKNIVLAWLLNYLVLDQRIDVFKYCIEKIKCNHDDLYLYDRYEYREKRKPVRLIHHFINKLGDYKRFGEEKYKKLAEAYHDAISILLKYTPTMSIDCEAIPRGLPRDSSLGDSQGERAFAPLESPSRGFPAQAKYVEEKYPVACQGDFDFTFKPQYRSELYRYTKKHGDNMFSRELHEINILDQAVICEHFGLLRVLLSHPKYSVFVKCVNMKKPGNGIALMHVAAHTGNIDIIRLLLEKNAVLEVEDSQGYTPLHYAARFDRNVPAVKFILSKGANINAQSSASKTMPLETALNYEPDKKYKMYKTLITLGATITPKRINHVINMSRSVTKGSGGLCEFTFLNYNSPFLAQQFFCVYPSKKGHKKVLIEGEQWHQQKRKESSQKYKEYKSKFKKISPNFVYARITFVVSDRTHQKGGHHGRKCLAFDLPLPYAPVTNKYEQSGFHVEDVYTPDDKKEKRGYQRYPGLLRDVLSTMPPEQANTIKSNYANRQSDSFHRRFHCSERALYAYLKSDKTLEALICAVEDKMPMASGLKFYAVILDIHSTRYLCSDCQTSMYYMYSSTGEFVRKLVTEIKKYKYKVLTKTGTLKSVVRFSAEQPGKSQKRIQLSDCYDFDSFFSFDIKRYTNKKGLAVLQRDNSILKCEDEEGKPFVNDKRMRHEY